MYVRNTDRLSQPSSFNKTVIFGLNWYVNTLKCTLFTQTIIEPYESITSNNSSLTSFLCERRPLHKYWLQPAKKGLFVVFLSIKPPCLFDKYLAYAGVVAHLGKRLASEQVLWRMRASPSEVRTKYQSGINTLAV